MAWHAATADWLYRTGWDERDLSKLDRAAVVFPYNKVVATRAAYASYLLFPSASRDSIARISAGLRRDPYSADLSLALALAKWQTGDHAGAQAEFDFLRRLVPKSPLLKSIIGEPK